MASSSNPIWNAEEVLNIQNKEYGKGFTCVGYAPSRRRRCWNPINRSQAYVITSELSTLSPGAAEIRGHLERLAEFSLCWRHGDQAQGIVSNWAKLVQAEARINQRTKAAPKTFDKRDQEFDSLWEMIRDLQEQLEQARRASRPHSSKASHTSNPSTRRTSSAHSSASRGNFTDYQSDCASVFTDDTEYDDDTPFAAAETVRQQKEDDAKRRAVYEARQARLRAAAEQAAAEQAAAEKAAAEKAAAEKAAAKKAAAEKAAAEEARRQEARRQAERERAEQLAERERQAQREAKRKANEAAAQALKEAEQREWCTSWEKYQSGWEDLKLRLDRGDVLTASGNIVEVLPWPTKSGRSEDVLGPSVREFFERGGRGSHTGPAGNKELLTKLRKVELFRWHADKIAHKFPTAKDISQIQNLAKVVTQTIYGMMEALKSDLPK